MNALKMIKKYQKNCNNYQNMVILETIRNIKQESSYYTYTYINWENS